MILLRSPELSQAHGLGFLVPILLILLFKAHVEDPGCEKYNEAHTLPHLDEA